MPFSVEKSNFEIMKKIGLEELKDIQLEMLKKIDDFCREQNIKYFLSAGTLIGAVRHHGYIPWDDDIDIMMLRQDYDKFIHSFNGNIKDLSVCAPELNWNFYAPFANVFDTRTILEERDKSYRGETISVKIDIFPFDNLPSNEFVYFVTRKIVLILNAIMRVKRLTIPFSEMTTKHKFVKCLLCWFPYTLAQKIIHTIATSNKNDKTADVFLRTFDIKKPMRARREIFQEAIYVPFEHYVFPIPQKADEFLRIRYGDYMILPPKEERIPHHNFTAYWK